VGISSAMVPSGTTSRLRFTFFFHFSLRRIQNPILRRPPSGFAATTSSSHFPSRTGSHSRNGIVTAPAACRSLDGGVAKEHDENQLLRISFPSCDYSPGDLALSAVHVELPRRRRLARRARNCGLIRNSPPLGESFRADDRSGTAKATPQTAFDLAS
jgi:hypothetical protein